MPIRTRGLPSGWYPETRRQTERVITQWDEKLDKNLPSAFTGIAPHAGWDFSGELANHVVSCLDRESDVIAVVGGHLPPSDKILCAVEDEFETPLGPIKAENSIRKRLFDTVEVTPDSWSDNTVEIQLPLIKHKFPRARVIYLRVSPTGAATTLGKALHEISQGLSVRISVLGSTDFTHYGPAYGFMPAGHGDDAIQWVREQNDRVIIEHLLSMNLELALQHANEKSSACSAGAAAAAAFFAALRGSEKGTLLGYRMSYDYHKSESFVGYAGICYQP